MKAAVKKAVPAGVRTPALIVFLTREDKPDLENRPELESLAGAIAPRLEAGDFKADHAAVLTLFPEEAAARRLIVVGLGEADKCGPARLRAAAAKGTRTAASLGADEAALVLPGLKGLSEEETAELAALGAGLGGYNFDELKKKNDKGGTVSRLTLIRMSGRGEAAVRRAAQAGAVAAEAVCWARDLGNRPANLVYPESLAAESRKMAKKRGLKVSVLTQAEARKKNMGLFLAVARGSSRPGRVIILEHNGGPAGRAPVVMIGKAVTFDSGGISIKPAEGMAAMKTDMMGGAAVLAAMQAAADLKLEVNLVGIVPAVENMPDGAAYRPGDVLTSMSGQTVEVISTDAEGRLILADALTLAKKYKPLKIVDAATLTGACVVALGKKCAAVLGNDSALIEELKSAAGRTGELVWELPLLEEYDEMLKSPTADMKNAAGRWAGTIAAGLFLQRFVDDGQAWAHLDIAGPARADKSSPDTPEGASGFGVHLLLKWLQKQ